MKKLRDIPGEAQNTKTVRGNNLDSTRPKQDKKDALLEQAEQNPAGAYSPNPRRQ